LIVFLVVGSCYKEVVGTVLVLPESAGYNKTAGIPVVVDPIAVAQTVVVRKAVLVVAQEVAGSWYTPSIIR
jgi:hydroxyethylthiazole kinase-like sugar kinase family protein